MQAYSIPLWKTSPFLRLVISLMCGILLQWYLQISLLSILLSASTFLPAFFLFYFLPLEIRFKFRSLQGFLLSLLVFVFGMYVTWQKDIRHSNDWYGNFYNNSSALLIRINEPLTEKAKSYKAEAVVEAVINGSEIIACEGKIFMYFSKDSAGLHLHYGDKIIIRKRLQVIKNAGNPGAFNYERYAAFQQAFHTVYLKTKEWKIVNEKRVNPLKKLIFLLQDNIIEVLQKNISGDKNVLGIAEALLIGYKEDLDKDLVQAYSNAGVVHIIAISGLHLGLIYVMLVWIFNRVPVIKKQKILNVVLVLACLWLFSLLTGASASVLRSAVMFTCIVIGKNFFKVASIYNSLAASAFVLLCYNPYFLWDVGFQLSYLAIIGIVWLQKPLCNLLYFKKSWLNKGWNMIAITLAAQIITFPVCIFYFHQFPNLFFITNFIAVPLSTVILFAEIFLIAFAWIPYVALVAGKITGCLVWLMNAIIITCNSLPFSMLDNIYASLATTIVLYLFVVAICAWFLENKKSWLTAAITFLFMFSFLQVYAKITATHQKKIIIYNVPQHQAIDFIYGNNYFFYGDSSMLHDGVLRNFHLKPARVALQASISQGKVAPLFHSGNEWIYFKRKMIIIDSAIHYLPVEKKVKADVLLLSKNPAVNITDLLKTIDPSLIVFDSSNSLWKIAGWKKECLALALPFFSIPEQGAFIMKIE